MAPKPKTMKHSQSQPTYQFEKLDSNRSYVNQRKKALETQIMACNGDSVDSIVE